MLDARVLDHLVRPVIAERAPEELVLFGPTLRDFETRSGELAAKGEDRLGIGVETAVVFLTPIALWIGKLTVEAALKAVVGKAGEAAFARWLDRAKGGGTAVAVSTGLTRAQLKEVGVVRLAAASSGLPAQEVDVLVDAIVARLATDAG